MNRVTSTWKHQRARLSLKTSSLNHLSDDNANTCEGKITNEECKKALNEMGIGTSPGSDGFTSEFYKPFWYEVGDDVVQSINNAFDKGELSICQKRGIITLLPKKDKPTDILNNLRPVTLLNVDYKIATKVTLSEQISKSTPRHHKSKSNWLCQE